MNESSGPPEDDKSGVDEQTADEEGIDVQARPLQSPAAFETSMPQMQTSTDAMAPATSSAVSEREEGAEAGQEAPESRTPAITSKEWAGSIVWARLAKFPWWPAQVLDESDPWIPRDAEPPRHGAIPVRFFGTYDFAWIESHRAICPYDKGHEEHSKHSRQKEFVQAMQEAEAYQETQELPKGFYEDQPPSPPPTLKKSRPASGKARSKRPGILGLRGTKKGADGQPLTKRSVRERQELILRRLALQPPPDSPYIHKMNLDGVRKLLELKKAGRYPPPPPKPAIPVVAQQPVAVASSQSQSQAVAVPGQGTQAVATNMAYPGGLVQISSGILSQAQAPTSQVHQYTQLLQHQQFLQQHLQAGQTPWYMQPSLYSPQLGFGYFTGQQGSVQGALMAAANPQHTFRQPDNKAKAPEAIKPPAQPQAKQNSSSTQSKSGRPDII